MFKISGMEKLTVTITTCFVICSVLLLPPSSNIFNHFNSNLTTTGKKPKLLGGLLATTEFDEESCLSRYHQPSLRKPSPYKPSPYLVSKLRSYEKLHKRCGPDTEAYKKATEQLGHKHHGNGSRSSVGDECRYVVWVPFAGLANRIISLVSVFLYALLTERVILVDQRSGITNLFCEPFPATSWLLPRSFPLVGKKNRDHRSVWRNSHCYGTMLKHHVVNVNEVPSYLYLYLISDYRDVDERFFCEEDQTFIGKVPWLVVKSNVYFVPSLWLIPSFQTELFKMFPEKETVFHHLSQYLLHPTNQVWGLVTRSYNAYLSRADERLGIQIRVFDRRAGYFQHVMDQIVACTQREKLLPELVMNTSRRSQRVKAVLVTSLHPEYSEKLKKVYWEQPTSTGEMIEVYQPSGERFQQTDRKLHDQKALAEVYLLSLTDNIVTTARSTFGYFAHSLGGLRPWILYKPANRTAPDPPCVKAASMEPCFHRAPLYGCQAKTIEITPFIRPCEDWNSGLRLVDAPQ